MFKNIKTISCSTGLWAVCSLPIPDLEDWAFSPDSVKPRETIHFREIYAAMFVQERRTVILCPFPVTDPVDIQIVLAHSEWQQLFGHKKRGCSNPRSTCIHPAELGWVDVKGQPVGQAQVILHQDPPLGAVHVGSFNFGAISVPVRPIKVPRGGKGGGKRKRNNKDAWEKAYFKNLGPLMKTLADMATQHG